MSGSDAPLAGVRVIDLTRLLPGPVATMHLADLGADVVKIEDCEAGDYLRTLPPQVKLVGRGKGNPMFEAVNRGKRSLRINLKVPAARDLFFRLVATADVLIESFRPGVMAKLGLGYEALAARSPRLVYCSLSGYGQDGPMAAQAGHDINYLAVAGVLDQIRAFESPAIPGIQIADLLGGAMSALPPLLAALYAAQRTGRGRFIDVAMAESMLGHHFFATALVDAGTPPVAERTLLTGGAPCYRCYETSDSRLLAVGALEHKFWSAFCEGVGLPSLKRKHWSLGEAPGSSQAHATMERIAGRIRECSAAEWEAVFSGIDACVTIVATPAEALAHPQFLARGVVHKRGAVSHIGPLARASRTTFTARPAPRAGQHTVELLRELGCDAVVINHLFVSGAVRGERAPGTL